MNSAFPSLNLIADGLWEVHFPFSLFGVQLGRRMVVIRLPDGSIQLQSPGPINDTLRAEIEKLGPVSSLVVPSNFHDTFVAQALRLFPSAECYAPAHFPPLKAVTVQSPAVQNPKSKIQNRKLLSFAEAPDWNPILSGLSVQGIPKIGEQVFLHRPSRSLLVADLVFNIEPDADAWTRLFFRFNGALNVLRPTRMFRSCIKDKAALAKSVEQIFQWDFDRLIPCHGGIVTTGAKERLRREFKF